MNALAAKISFVIQESGGWVPFGRFMEMALYEPGLGYYERPERAPGRAGDFFTSVSVGSLFGELLAFRFAQWLEPWLAQGCPAVHLVEAGAHDGQLAADILAWLKANRPALAEKLQYWIIEPSTTRQRWQRDKLGASVRWAESLDVLPGPVQGVIFANELLDAFPVHRFDWQAQKREWLEWGVGVAGGEFVWRVCPDQKRAAAFKHLLPAVPEELAEVLPDGYGIEVSPLAVEWWQKAARKLGRGMLLTFDYGLTEAEILAPGRTGGTLRAYHQHQQSPDVLGDPGERDLTAHVHFPPLQRAGEAAGLTTQGLVHQATFLTQIVAELEQGEARVAWDAKRVRQLKTLTHPDFLGVRFKVLVQGKTKEMVSQGL